uniref:EGF-like domain-containing protein n=1 Tax=Strongyloides papillosus TaxID=174720 RepID=A0A0N5C012_STREA
MGCANILLKLLIALCFYIIVITYAHGSTGKKATKTEPKSKIYKYNVNYCIDDKTNKELNRSNIQTGIDMISKHSCIQFSYNSTCYDYKSKCEQTCTSGCRNYKHSDPIKCKKCFEPFRKCNDCTYECDLWKKKYEKQCKSKTKLKECKKKDSCKKCTDSCKNFEEKYEGCKDDCVEKCLDPFVNCVKKCEEVTLPCKDDCVEKCLDPFFYNRSRTDSDFYFDGSITLNKENVYNMEIDVSCNKRPGCIAKKVLMYLGLIPTVRRTDRDDYITVYDDNINSKYIHQYSKRNNGFLYTEYDYSSIGHFPDNYGAKSGKKTYVRKWLDDSRVFLTGQEIRPVFSDLKWLDIVYCKNHSTTTVKCKNNGYPKSDGSKCECPTGYTGDTCEKLQFTGPLCPDGLIDLKNSTKRHLLALYSKSDCTVKLTAPEGKKIRINVEAVNCTSKNPCFENDCLQIKYNSDMTLTGLCLCGTIRNTSLTTTSNKALIQYTGKNYRNYAFLYYQVVQN